MGLRWVSVAFLLCLGVAQAQQFRLADIKVSGNQKFTAAAVISACGLRVGQSVVVKDVEAATHRLADTGLFATVDYRYDPKNDAKTVNRIAGYVLTWKVEEAPTSATVRLDFPGIDEQQLWHDLKIANALLDARIPSNALVVEYYRRNIEQVLRKRNRNEQVVAKNEANLETGQFSVVFRPADRASLP
jgi:outer membrane protein assembly factor BamA